MTSKFRDDLPALLRSRIDDREVLDFLSGLDPKAKTVLADEDELNWISEKSGVVVYGDPESKRITTVFLYGQGVEDCDQYQGPLPHGLDFTMDKSRVQASFPRKPDFTSGEHDTWDFDDYRLAVQYRRSGTISVVTVSGDF
jgi:hypothetical protein